MRRASSQYPLVFAAALSFAALVHAPAPVSKAMVTSAASANWQKDVISQLEQQEYLVSLQEDGLQAPNRAQNLRTYFRAGGIDVVPRQSEEAVATWQFGWRTSRWGRVGQLTTLSEAKAAPRVNGACVSYAHEGLDEWYENKQEGLEQGFTVHERPAGMGPLIISGRIDGGLRATLSAAEDAVDFVDEHGALALRYSELHVWDARGEELPSHLAVDGLEVAICIEDDGANYPLTIDPLLTSPSWSAESDQASASFGFSVATAGDVNGDGYSDVIVGAYQYDNGESNEGRAYAYYGSAAGLAATPAWTAEGNLAGVFFGRSVATAGDVNGDGFCDVIVGASGYNNGQSNEGRAFVYHGSAAGLSLTADWTAESDQAGAEFGFSVATAGDVNGDGFSDIIVGAWNYDGVQSDVGRAYVYHGSAAGLAAIANWTAQSDETFARFGSSVATAGDVNGDGYSDVIVGAPFADNGQLDEGRAFVYHGSATGLLTTAAWSEDNDQASSWYGWSVNGAGDVNGDGYSDVIVGAPLYDNVLSDKGRAYVYHGSALGLLTTAAWAVESNQAGANYAIAVATAGDVNGDGYADVIVGASSYDNGQTNEGRASVYHGSAAGLSTLAAWTAESNVGGAQLGNSVATAGDVNGDGFSDVIVGAYAYTNGQSFEGGAFVYHGSSDDLDFPESWSAESNQASANYGNSVASAGDVNGDGFTDVIIGSSRYDGGLANQGRAYVFHGSATGLAASPAWTIEGEQENEILGASVATAGDVNGDGFSDVIVGAPLYGNVQNQEGRALVYLGSSAGLDPLPAWTVEGDQIGATFGWSVGTAGDVNGDGFSDVIVGATNYDNGQLDEGGAFVYLGSAAGLATSTHWSTESDLQAGSLGVSVGTAGDVNGDGFSDVIVGTDRFYNAQGMVGRAMVFHGSASGLSLSPGWAANGYQASAHFGFCVGTAGDVNGDGFSDLIVGSYNYDNGQEDEGRVFVYLGSSLGANPLPDWFAESHQIDAQFGYSVGTAGDVNADGFSDVIIGARGYDSALTNEGRAYVYRGSATGLATLADWAPTSGQTSAEYGYSVATAGDVNGDGFSDVIVGADLYDNSQTNEGRAFVYYGNGGDGLDRMAGQARTDDSAPISLLGKSDSGSAFLLKALARTPAGRGRVRLQYELKRFDTPFNGVGLTTGPISDSGLPVLGVGSAVALSELASGLTEGTLFHWRLRILSDSPFFPRSPWFSLPGNGMGEADLRTASVTDVAELSPSASWLRPCAPNPFTTTTKLSYALPVRGRVRLSIYDVSGRKVATLSDEFHEAGAYQLSWNGRDAGGRRVSAGVYFARLTVGDRVEALKLLLAR